MSELEIVICTHEPARSADWCSYTTNADGEYICVQCGLRLELKTVQTWVVVE